MELCHFDTPLLRFRVIDSTYAADLEITWVNEEKRNMLPLDLELTNEGLYQWLKRRVIPKNRSNVHSFLSKCGLNLNRPLSIIHLKAHPEALSMNKQDSEDNSTGLYESDCLAHIEIL